MHLLDDLPPFLYGGSMIEMVTMTGATWAPVPQKFEAGVPNMAQAVGFGAALDYLSEIGMQNVAAHENVLTGYLLEKMNEIADLQIVGPTTNVARGAALSFTVADIHPHDLGQYLDSQGVAVRTGHHCAWPLAKSMGVPASTRASLYLYNDERDCDALIDGILGAQKYFGRF
jgi:cysteine desulfurase/selenocysteine lyase